VEPDEEGGLACSRVRVFRCSRRMRGDKLCVIEKRWENDDLFGMIGNNVFFRI
jgi:hypothetical protein